MIRRNTACPVASRVCPAGVWECNSTVAPTKEMIANTVPSRTETRSLFLIEPSVAYRDKSTKLMFRLAQRACCVASVPWGVTAFLRSWLWLKDHRKPADSFRLQGESYLDAVGDPDKRNAAVHPVVPTVEGHCPFNIAGGCPFSLNRQDELVGFSHSP